MKKNYLTRLSSHLKRGLIVMAVFLTITTYAQDTSTGLVLHYTFDDVTETIVPDASGAGNMGTLEGAPTIVEGYNGMGLNMMTKPDFLRLPSNLNVGMTSMTFAAWVNFSELKNATRFFDFGNGADASNTFLVFIPSATGDNTPMRVRYREVSGTASNLDVAGGTLIPVGSWAHVALTFQWNAGTQRSKVTIYLNGAAVATTDNYPYNPDMLGATADNFLGRSRWNQDTNGFNGTLDDVRFYNRALTGADIVALTGLTELNNQFEALDLGDVSQVTEDLTLPATMGENGVTVSWETSNPAIIDSTGKVTRPEKYDAYVRLTATLSLESNGQVNTMKKIFNVRVLSPLGTPEVIAQWDFSTESVFTEGGAVKVSDISGNEFVGTVMNEARIRTIGETEQFNVLDLGNGTGHFDMGTSVGEAFYNLNEYTIMGYFYIDENYSELTNDGNFMWTFSNTADAPTDRNGYIIGRLNNMSQEISSGYYATGNQGLYVGQAAPKGAWHHIAYTQTGTTGTIYVDGVQAATGSITNLPFTTLPREGRTGTNFNWLGRANYPSDSYLRQTLLYDFNVYSLPLTQDNLLLDFGVTGVIDQLNNAYSENPDFISQAIVAEAENLTLGDLSALTTDITLPTQGTLDSEVKISWSSSHPQLISNEGVVSLPDYFNFNVTLTATLAKGAQMINKDFTATVLVKSGTEFTGDLIAHYDFSNAEGRFVKSLAEKQFEGSLVNEATIREIGTEASGKFNVLDLGNATGYFDMGEEVGKILVHAEDFTISAYYRIDTAYTELASNGNFLWTFSNSADALTDQNGYIIGSLLNLSNSISPAYYTAASGNQAVAFGQPAMQGGWHHFGYTQQAGIGTVYIDGMPMAYGDITNTPASALYKPGFLGTPYNWIGRSNYTTDVYLRNTLVYDFRVYKRALNDLEILATELDVSTNIEALDIAYAANANIPNSVESVMNSPYRIIGTEAGFRIAGLTGSERVSLFDLAGRQLKRDALQQEFVLDAGIYIVKINNYTAKVLVK